MSKRTLITRSCLIVMLFVCCLTDLFSQERVLRLGVAGLTHGHVGWILGRKPAGDLEITGIAEPNRDLAARYAQQYGFSMDIVFNTVEEMVAATKPDAVAAFGNIYDHLSVVESCAPRGIHVMVEKPLAVSLEHARRMRSLALKHGIHLLTNYETSWYPTNERAYDMLHAGRVGKLTQLVVRDGHRGPVKIGVGKEFLEWLTDPVLNGGGALMDFGCYGANLSTWLQDGRRPLGVTAITQQFQPGSHARVDDEATILLTYPDTKVTIQASWNWPIGRKDMEVYGTTGVIYADNKNILRVRDAEGYDGYREERIELKERAAPFDDPFALFAAVIRKQLVLKPYDPYTLENNMVVMEILEAARKSARTGKTVRLP